MAKPTVRQIRRLLEGERLRVRRNYALASTLSMLLGVGAATCILVMLLFPALRVSGGSMLPGLREGDVVVVSKIGGFAPGDVVGFYRDDRILIKRVIAGPGSVVDMDAAGRLYVDGKKLDEPYVSTHAIGECDAAFPIEIPEGRYFVAGDHRETSVDSRSSSVGLVDGERIIGRAAIQVWPPNEIRILERGVENERD